MKKLLSFLFLACITATTTKAQIVDTNIRHILAVEIEPVYATISDTVLSSRLGARLENDNLQNSAEVSWELLTDKGITTFRGRYTMSAEEYGAWPKEEPYFTMYPFIIVVERLKRVHVKDFN